MRPRWRPSSIGTADKYSGQAIAFLIAATFTWWGNRTFTFAHLAARGARGLLREWLSFLAANAFGGLANYLTYAVLVTFTPPPAGNPYVAVAAGSLVGLLFNFTLSKRLVFRG